MSDLIERLRRVADDAALIAVPCAGEAADRIEALEAALTNTAAHLAAAISLLERTPKAKKAAASDTMFDIMLDDYRKALAAARAALAPANRNPDKSAD